MPSQLTLVLSAPSPRPSEGTRLQCSHLRQVTAARKSVRPPDTSPPRQLRGQHRSGGTWRVGGPGEGPGAVCHTTGGTRKDHPEALWGLHHQTMAQTLPVQRAL